MANTGVRTATAWEHLERVDRHDAAYAERQVVQVRIEAARAEREGRNLCVHGAGDADEQTGWSPRCAFCRISTELQ